MSIKIKKVFNKKFIFLKILFFFKKFNEISFVKYLNNKNNKNLNTS